MVDLVITAGNCADSTYSTVSSIIHGPTLVSIQRSHQKGLACHAPLHCCGTIFLTSDAQTTSPLMLRLEKMLPMLMCVFKTVAVGTVVPSWMEAEVALRLCENKPTLGFFPGPLPTFLSE